MSKGIQVFISLRWDKKHQTYFAAATNLRGVMGQGKTPQAALASVQEAIRWQLRSPTAGTRPSTAWRESNAHE